MGVHPEPWEETWIQRQLLSNTIATKEELTKNGLGFRRLVVWRMEYQAGYCLVFT